jgi:hypothetical protein
VAVVVALLLGVGLKVWAEEHRDDCDRYVEGDRRVPDSMYVKSGTRTVMVPCSLWVMRQPVGVQAAWLAEEAAVLVAVGLLVGDWRREREV